MLKSGQVVALDRTSALLAGRRQHHAALQDRQPAAAALRRAGADDGAHRATPAHDAVEVEDLLVELRRAGCLVEDLEIGRADLEDVFLEIMQADTAPGAFVPQATGSTKVEAHQ